MNNKLIASLLLTLPFSTIALAQDSTSIGLGVGYQQKPYAGDDSNWVPVPHLEYQNGKAFIKGLKGGVYLFDNKATKVDLHVKYQPLNFKPGDADGALRGLDRRKATIEVGAGASHSFQNKMFVSSSVDADVLGRSKGVNVDAGGGMVYQVNDHFKLVPKVGAIWSSKKHNDYYYGVSSSESRDTGVSRYDPSSSVTPYVGVGAVVNATNNLHIAAGVKFDFLPNEVKDSPMTKRSTVSNIAVGVNYSF